MLRLLVVLVLCVGAYWPAVSVAADGQEAICDQPYVVLCDNFAARALGQGDFSRATYKNRGWTYFTLNPPGGTISIVNQVGPQGTTIRVMEHQCSGTYGLEAPGANVCTGVIQAEFIQSIPQGTDVWLRFYTKWSSNFKHSWGEKHSGVGWTSNSGTNNGFNMFNRAKNYGYPWIYYFNLGAAPQAYPSPNPCVQTFPLPTEYYLFPCPGGTPNTTDSVNGQWYCLEGKIRMNPDVDGHPSTGIAAMYVNGVEQFNYTNLNLFAHSVGSNFQSDNTHRAMNLMNLYGRWYCAGDTQVDGPDFASCVCRDGPGTCNLTDSTHPTQQRWHANVVVSTQRVGCLGGIQPPPPADTVAPSSPTNLQVAPQ